MHFHKATHILGLLLISLSVFMLLPVPFSLYYGENDAPAFLISAALSLVAGLIAYKTTSLDGDLRPKEGFAVVTFAWLILYFFGSLRHHLHPQAVVPVRMNGEPVSREIVTNVLGYFIFLLYFSCSAYCRCRCSVWTSLRPSAPWRRPWAMSAPA